MRQEYLRAAAEAYANIHEIESDCYHYIYNGFDPVIQQRIAARYGLSYGGKPVKHSAALSATALAELQYPVNETTGFAWSGNERAAFAGISKATWSRNNYSDHIEFIIKDIRSVARHVRRKIDEQLVDESEGY
ncbi:hypothetical protein [Psychrobacter sp.]|uniref:hypothetical protein n=1 Tax=Psychrobacter sp. TaxID=56811 RepID=UPI003C70B4B1